jgi:hypothetical protein
MSPEQHHQYAGKDVVLRESMIKSLPCPDFADDPSLLTLDVLRCEALRIGTTLSAEAIIIMTHNGVSHEVFKKMSNDALEELRRAFLPQAMELDGRVETDLDVLKRIVASCYGLGGVGGERRKRAAVQEGKSIRAAGLGRDWGESEDGEEDQSGAMMDSGERFGVDPVSGQSGSIAERYV